MARALAAAGAEDLGAMFPFKRDFNDDFCGARDLALSRRLNLLPGNFAQRLDRNKDLIPTAWRRGQAVRGPARPVRSGRAS